MDFIYDNNGKPYALKYDGTTYYYVLNLQGDVISIITHWGESYGSYTYDAWGNILAVSGDIAYLNPIRYRGYYYDSETRLYYLGNRYYDPQVRRFISADGYASTGQGNIGYNMFAYCLNKPVTYKDVNGHEAITAIAVIGGALIGGIAGLASAAVEGDSLVGGFVVGAASGAATVVFQAGVLGSMAISAIGNIYEQKINDPTGSICWHSVTAASVSGAIGYGLGSAADAIVKAAGNEVVGKVVMDSNSEVLGWVLGLTISTTTEQVAHPAAKPKVKHGGNREQYSRAPNAYRSATF